jgi:Kef-type K+ transport system membrane component KefB
MHNVWMTASLWLGVAFLASLISIRIGVSVALVEIVLGVLAGNALTFHTNDWTNFLASFGAILLTFPGWCRD